MKYKEAIEPHKEEISTFLNQLPDNPIEIKGIQAKNELYINGKKLSLARSLKVRNHSPAGYNWGYSGSGPAQSALAILLEYVDAKTAGTYYQDLKFGWVAGLPQTDFCQVVNLRQIMASIIFGE